MDPLQVGHFLRLRKLGELAHRSADREASAPPSVAAAFPSGVGELRVGPEGIWFGLSEELGGAALHWLAGSAVRSARGLPPVAEVAFDLPSGRALLTVEGGRILELDLGSGGAREVRLEGLSSPPGRLGRVFWLEGDRAVVRLADTPSRGLVFRCAPGAWSLERSFPFHGDFVVVGRRALVGGAGILHVLVFPEAGVRTLATVNNHGGQVFGVHRGRARFYGPHGGWELSGLDEALAAVDAGSLDTAPYVG